MEVKIEIMREKKMEIMREKKMEIKIEIMREMKMKIKIKIEIMGEINIGQKRTKSEEEEKGEVRKWGMVNDKERKEDGKRKRVKQR